MKRTYARFRLWAQRARCPEKWLAVCGCGREFTARTQSRVMRRLERHQRMERWIG